MTEQIHKLIEHHKLAKKECWQMLNGLIQIYEDKLSEEEREDLQLKIKELETEYSLRQIFISDLENLLKP